VNKQAKVVSVERLGSGVAKSITAWTAFLFGLHCISLSSSGLIPFSWVASVWPGASIPWVLSIALIFCLIHGLAYATIGISTPVEGADYVLASRTLSPILSFASSWTLVLFSGIVAGGLAAWVPKTALPTLLRPMYLIKGDPRFAELADLVSSTTGTMVFGALVIIIAALTTLQRRTNMLKAMLNAGLIFGAIAWAVIYFSLGSTHDPQVFHSAWDRFMLQTGQHGCFDCRVPLAIAAGMKLDQGLLPMTMAGLIMGFWIYYGYYIPTFFSEEVKKPTRSLLVASAGSLIVAYIVFFIAAIMLGRLVPSNWIAAEGYLWNNPDQAAKAAGGQPVVAMPWITFYAAILKPNFALLLVVAFGWIFTLINLVQTYLFYTGRILWSWSMDRIVPDWIVGKDLAHPNPNRAIFIISALAFLGLADSAFNGPLGTQLTFAFFAVVTQLIPVTALTLLPILSKETFGRVPNILRRSVLGVPLLSIVGGFTLLYLLWMVAASFIYPAAGIANPRNTILLLVLLIASGMVVFYMMRKYRLRTTGIDVNLTYKEMPRFDILEDARFD
jgi:APA family basic amino acid/polyamine antiporter